MYFADKTHGEGTPFLNFALGMCHFLNPSLFEIQDCLMLANGSKMQGKE